MESRAKGVAMDSVLAVTFTEDSKAYEALSSLKELDDQGQVDLAGAAVVVRREDGHLETKDQAGDTELEGTAVGGIVGLIIGILGGPLGVLLGGATGLLIGSGRCSTSRTPTRRNPRWGTSPARCGRDTRR
jgi:uncharacterized membrane protein